MQEPQALRHGLPSGTMSFCPGKKALRYHVFFTPNFKIQVGKKLFLLAAFFQFPLDKRHSGQQESIIEESNEYLEEKTSNSVQTNQVNEKTIANSQCPLKSTTGSAKSSKASQRSMRFLSTYYSCIHPFYFRF